MHPNTLPIATFVGFVATAVLASGARASESDHHRVGVNGSWLQDADDSATVAPRISLDEVFGSADRVVPGATSFYRSEVNQLTYHWWLKRGRADFGLGLGTLLLTTGPGARGIAPAQVGPAAPSLGANTVLTIGMRYRTSEGSVLYADAAGLQGASRDSPDVYGKVGIEFKTAQSRWNVAYGGLGLRLAGDTKMTLRLRKGGLNVVMRRNF